LRLKLLAFPFHSRNSGLSSRPGCTETHVCASLTLTVAGLCWILTSFPTPAEYRLPFECTPKRQAPPAFFLGRRRSWWRRPGKATKRKIWRYIPR